MAKYRVTETLPALRRFNDGEGDSATSQTIGDILDGYDQNQTAELEDE